MKNWTFGRRLVAGFAVIVALSIATSVVAVIALRTVVERKDDVIHRFAQNVIDSERLLRSAERESNNLRGYLLTRDEQHLDALRDANDTFGSNLAVLQARTRTESGRKLLADIESAATAHQAAVSDLLARITARDEGPTVVDTVGAEVAPLFATLDARTRAFIGNQAEQLESRRRGANAAAESAQTTMLVIGVLTLLVAPLLAFFLVRTLTRQIGSSVQHIRSSSAELHAAASQQASGAKEQSTAMNEITTTINELLATSRQIAESAKRVAAISAETEKGAQGGDASVHNARAAVSRIREQVDTIVRHMLELGHKSQQIGGILEVIKELADQTNILAINATIEAAGAGSSGRRFAVLGEEIRRLADRVGSSTKDIRQLIDEVRAAVNTTVMATEAGTKTVDRGEERFTELESSFGQIARLVANTREAAREIELSTKQQASAVEQVNVAVANVAQATRESEAGSGQTLQTATQLADLAGELVHFVQSEGRA